MMSIPGTNDRPARAATGILALCFLFLAAWFNYFLERESFTVLVGIFAGMFAIYMVLVHPRFDSRPSHFTSMVLLAVAARFIILFAIPNLSDDYYRFIWDGRLFLSGINPFDLTPSELMAAGLEGTMWAELYDGMNSRDYHTIYPPVCQLVFAIANIFSPGNIEGAVLLMKLVFFASESAAIFLLVQLSRELSLPRSTPLLYALNPLVIIEFCGNLHFEALMITFLLLAILLLIRNRAILSAMAFSAAILVKLHPLMLLPFIIRYLGMKKGAAFAAVTGAVTLAGFALIFLPAAGADVRMDNFMSSARLYFESFEFNAGVYYVFRWIGFQYFGYNPIDKVGKLMAAFHILAMAWLLLSMRRNIHSLIGVMLFTYLSYYMFATTVHPWYILPMLPLALLVNYRFAVVWTAVIILSYFPYSRPGWIENFGLLTLEYTCIFVFLTYELSNRRKLADIVKIKI